jgi:hypothetical protein
MAPDSLRLPQQRHPIGLARFGFPDNLSPANVALYVMTKEGSNRINSRFHWIPRWNVVNHFLNREQFPDGFVAERMGSTTFSGMISGGGNVYFYNQAQMIFFGPPVNSLDGNMTNFRASSRFTHVSTSGWIVFCEDTKSFFQAGGVSTVSRPIQQTGTVLLNYRNTGMELVEMLSNIGLGPAGAVNYFYAIMKDQQGNHRILRAFSSNMAQTHWRVMNTTVAGDGAPVDFNRVSLWAVGGQEAENIYFALDNKVYAFSITDNTSYVVYESEFGEITFLKFVEGHPFDSRASIMVGSFDGNAGTLELFNITSRIGPLVPARDRHGNELRFGQFTYPVAAKFDRIVDVVWTRPLAGQ